VCYRLTLRSADLVPNQPPRIDIEVEIYSVEPGTPSHDAMRLLATWAATKDAEAAHPSTRDADDRASPKRAAHGQSGAGAM
jgi:hypothetical protein